MYETLLTNEECARAIDCGPFYRVIADNRDMNYEKYLTQGDVQRSHLTEFNSNNTRRLNVDEIKEKLLTCDLVREALKQWRSRENQA